MIPALTAILGFLLVPSGPDKQPEIVHVIHWVEGLFSHKPKSGAEKLQAATGLILDGLNVAGKLDKGQIPNGLTELLQLITSTIVQDMNHSGELGHGSTVQAAG